MALRSSSVVTGSSRTTMNIPVPAGAASGDIAVAGVYVENGDTITPPSGFTEKADLGTNPTTQGRIVVYWKRLTGADSGNYTFSWTNSTFSSGVCALYTSRVGTGDPFDATPGTQENTSGSTTVATSTSPTTDLCDAVWISSNFAGSATWTPPTNYIERRDNDTSYLATRTPIPAGSTGTVTATSSISNFLKAFLGALTPATATTVQRVDVTKGSPANANAFAPTLPTHATGDRLLLFVTGKYNTTTVPTIDQSWTLVKSGTGGTGTTGADVGQVFWAVYAKDATSSSETAPTVTPGGTVPNSWEWLCVSHRASTGTWADSIGADVAWVQSASDTTTGSPLTGTAGAWTGVQPTAGDAVLAVGVIPTDAGTALGATTLTATGLSGGVTSTDTVQYQENGMGQDTATVWAGWIEFTGTASAGLAMSFTVTGASNQSGSLVAAALRQAAGSNGTLTTTTGSAAAAGESGAMNGTATLSTTTGGASSAGESGAMTGGATFSATTAGNATAGGFEGAIEGTIESMVYVDAVAVTVDYTVTVQTKHAVLNTDPGNAAAAGGTGAITAGFDATFETTTGGAVGAGGSGSLTGGATFETTEGSASTAGGSGALTGGASFTTTTGDAAAAGGTGSMTGGTSATFETTTGNASATGEAGTLSGGATLTSTTGDASAGGGTGSLTGTASATFATTTGDATAAGGIGAMVATGAGDLTTLTGDAAAGGGTGSMTGTATFTTTSGDATAGGGIGAIVGSSAGTFTTLTGDASAGGGTGALTGTVTATFTTLTGDATAGGGTGALTGGATFETATGDATASGGTGAIYAPLDAVFVTLVGDALAGGQTGALVAALRICVSGTLGSRSVTGSFGEDVVTATMGQRQVTGALGQRRVTASMGERRVTASIGEC